MLGLLLLAVGLVGLWQGPPTEVGAERWWFALPLLAVCGVMLGKRRRPVGALALGLGVFAVDAAMGGSFGTMLGLIDLIYSAALYAGETAVRRLRIGTGAVVVGGAAATFVVLGDLRQAVNAGLLLFALAGTPVWWGLSVRRQAELAALATARAADLQRLADLREAEVLRGERTRMARDLHDALAGNLSAIAIHAEAALASGDGAAGRRALEAIRATSVASMAEMRSMILLLRAGGDETTAPARLAELGPLLATARAAGLGVDARVAPLPPLPAAVDQAAYRIVQEALTNAAKHAPGARVEVGIGVAAGALDIEVRSAAGSASAGPPASGGIGLLTMRERAEALGGRFAAGWAPDAGRCWRVHATIPLEEPR